MNVVVGFKSCHGIVKALRDLGAQLRGLLGLFIGVTGAGGRSAVAPGCLAAE
jgi:hypothetical protein